MLSPGVTRHRSVTRLPTVLLSALPLRPLASRLPEVERASCCAKTAKGRRMTAADALAIRMDPAHGEAGFQRAVYRACRDIADGSVVLHRQLQALPAKGELRPAHGPPAPAWPLPS